MRRTTSTVLAIGLAATAFAGAAADPSTLVDCAAEDGVTLVVEGEAHEEGLTSAPFSYPEGEFDTAGGDPAGDNGSEFHQIRVPLAFNHVDGQRATANVTIEWSTPGDLDLDILDSAGEIVAEDHAFNIDTQSFVATGVFAPEACETYTLVINNSYAAGNQAIDLTAEVTSKAPRRR